MCRALPITLVLDRNHPFGFGTLPSQVDFRRLLDIEVLLTLCNDQFSRWAVQQVARESFFFLQGKWCTVLFC